LSSSSPGFNLTFQAVFIPRHFFYIPQEWINPEIKVSRCERELAHFFIFLFDLWMQPNDCDESIYGAEPFLVEKFEFFPPGLAKDGTVP
jgi:hypothetical protein